MSLTLLIPTLNRAAFVERALRYYGQAGFRGIVSLGDSSEPEQAEKIRRAVQAVEGQLQVEYRSFPSPPYTSNAPVLLEMAQAATTPYVVYAGDDDFLIPNTLEQCTRYLDDHPDHSAAHGLSLVIRLGHEGAYGPITQVNYMEGHVLKSESAAERWQGYARHALSTQYYVHRRETWLRMYQDVATVPIQYWGTEFLPCSLSAVAGKIHEVDRLSCIFQVNSNRQFGWTTHSMYQLALEPRWSEALRAMRAFIVQAIAETDQRPSSEAEQIVDKELWRHLMIMLQAHYDDRYDPGNWFSNFKARFPWLVQLVRILRQVRRNHYRRLSLHQLLDPRHPSHADFIPVYQLITTGPYKNDLA